VEPAVIADFYDFGPILGSGGFGEVKEILHAKTFQPFAGKLLRKSNLIEDTVGAAAALKDSTSVDNAADITEASFRRTIETLMNHVHPHIVAIAHTFEDPMFYYVVMEKCAGGSLGDHVDQLRDEGRQFDMSKLRDVACMVAQALGFLHNMFLLHRDVKPENVLYESTEGSVVKLADFDMCCSCPPEQEYVLANFCVGTLGYMAPEVLSKGQYSKQSDLFALGVLIHQCATTQLPEARSKAEDVTEWCAQTEKELREGSGPFAETSPEFREALVALLRAVPEDRPARVERFVECPWIGWARKRSVAVGKKKKKDDVMQRLLKE
jgi:serine/threonine protein kinase